MARKTRKKVPNDPAPAFSPPPRPADTAPNPLDLDATALMAAYRTGLYRPSQVIGRCITLIDHANPRLNFLVEDRFEAALAEAQASDERWKRGEPAGELDGVPITVKESFDVAGMKTTGGLAHRRDHVADADAGAVALLRAAGAIVLGKTNTPALCFCQETDNALYGRTNNPWDPRLTTGGSSGGEAVAVSIGASAFGLGSDIGGSIRIPSTFCGVVGYKPGPAAFPYDGHFPAPELTQTVQSRMLAYGPLTRSVRDARRIAKILKTGSGQVPDAPDSSEPARDRIGRVLVVGSFSRTRLHPDVDRVLQQAAGALEGISGSVTGQVPPFLSETPMAWQRIMSLDGARDIAKLAYPSRFPRLAGHPLRAAVDYARSLAGLATEQHPYLSWSLIGAFLFAPSPREWRDTEAHLEGGFAWLHEHLRDGGVILSPAYPEPAQAHGEVYKGIFSLKLTFQQLLPYITLANVFGLPALVLPCGFTEDGEAAGVSSPKRTGNSTLENRKSDGEAAGVSSPNRTGNSTLENRKSDGEAAGVSSPNRTGNSTLENRKSDGEAAVEAARV
ncbi:amidase, partial [Myxococcota bacterium]|nr:amidase [Myxococcota bacterium]